MNVERVNRAVIWSAIDVILRQGVQFVITVFLARLIAPEAFGTIALLTLFISIAGVFIDGGFSSALIQCRDHKPEDESTVFWFNITSATLAAGLLVLAAHWISVFYAQPVLEPLMWAMAINLWLSAFIAVHSALLTKRLDFKTQMMAALLASLVSGCVAIWLALNNWGVWALALQTITATIIRVLFLWCVYPWRPLWIFSMTSFRRLFRFGGFMLLSALLDVTATRLYTVLIGTFYSFAELGYYDRAVAIKDMPQGIISSIFTRVAFPVFSTHSHDLPKLREGLRISIIVVMSVNLPIMFGILAVSDVLVPLLLGNQWVPAIPLLQVLCGAGLLWPLQVANLDVLKAQGRSNLFFRLEILKKILLVSMILIASQVSVQAIAWGFLFNSILSFFINAKYTQRFLGYSAWQQLRDICPYFTLSLIMEIIVSLMSKNINFQSLLLELVVKVFAGIIIYAGTGYLLKLKGFFLIKNIFIKKRNY
jgi:teichuronic acid exporter